MCETLVYTPTHRYAPPVKQFKTSKLVQVEKKVNAFICLLINLIVTKTCFKMF